MTPKEKAQEMAQSFLKDVNETFEVCFVQKVHFSFAIGLAITAAIKSAEMIREEIKYNVGTYAEENRVFWHEVIVELIKMK
jgi:hypothetical protein